MTRTEMPLAVTFDLDGAILESEKLVRRCFLAACNEVYGADVAIYNRCVLGARFQPRRSCEWTLAQNFRLRRCWLIGLICLSKR